MKIPQKDIPLRVLIYLEDGEFVAHLLEMDLVGTGQTAVEAQKELHDAFEAQITFCLQNNVDPFRPAPQKLFNTWDELQSQFLQTKTGAGCQERNGPSATYINYSESHRARYMKRNRFQPAQPS
jgi:hypothetical protein